MIAKAWRFLAAACFAMLAGSASAQTSVEAERGIVRVVVIYESPEGPMLYGSGSGFVVAPNLVVTNAHVVAPARQRPEYGVAIVPPQGDGRLTARIIRYSPLSELALLEYRGGQDIEPLTISTVEPRPGDAVVAFGYPDVDYQGATGADLLRPSIPSRDPGEIASLQPRAPTGDPIPTINHTAIISSGSSGGPLLDECGRVIGVNSWHVSGAATRERRGVSTRAGQLLQFLDEAGITPALTDERCLTGAERDRAERNATISAQQQQIEALAERLETADRLTRIAVVILIGGTLALFVAVCVLGAVLLSRRRTMAVNNGDAAVLPQASHPEPFDTPKRSRLGVLSVVGGATIAAILIVSVSIALLRARQNGKAEPEQSTANFSGAIACTLDRDRSIGGEGVADASFTASGNLCVNERTLYAPIGEGSFRRVIVLGEGRVLDVWTINTSTGEFRRERFPLSDAEFAAANQAVAENAVGRGCNVDPGAITRRNEALMRFAQGEPTQRLVWRCQTRN